MAPKATQESSSADLTIQEAAEAANVSVATIRNWIKTGYLVRFGNRSVTRNSFHEFMTHVAGKEKLNARANKSRKQERITAKSNGEIGASQSTLTNSEAGTAYEHSLSESYRNREGIYYTPLPIVKDMFDGIEIKPDDRFLDPCCGSGNFIAEAIRRGIAPQNVYGFDTDENAVRIAKERIRTEFGSEPANIVVGDFLECAQKLKNDGIAFDLIFTNPPWGKKLRSSDKDKYAVLFGCGNSKDTSSLFMNAGLSILKNGGTLGFLLQEAFFNISSFEESRKKLLTKQILRLVDYGNVFKGLITKAQAVIVRNCPSDNDSTIACRYNDSTFLRTTQSFQQNPKRILNFWTSEAESEVIGKLYALPHITLAERAKWALGIVTGNNRRFCKNKPDKGDIPVYKGSDITQSGLKEPTLFIHPNFSQFQQVAPIEMYEADEKLIYKFISSNLCFFYDDKQRYILNSANLLIPIDTGISAKQLSDLLNSKVINWLFRKLFNTHKVLRGDLELLPVHTDYFNHYIEFSDENYLNYLQIPDFAPLFFSNPMKRRIPAKQSGIFR